MPRLTFLPLGLVVECASGETVFQVALRAGVPVTTACVGRGTCGLCRVRVKAGEDNLSLFNDVEKRHLGNVYFITKERLSCQTQVLGDASVEVALRETRQVKLGKR
jgi:ferredoxin, 2Fe-2S